MLTGSMRLRTANVRGRVSRLSWRIGCPPYLPPLLPSGGIRIAGVCRQAETRLNCCRVDCGVNKPQLAACPERCRLRLAYRFNTGRRRHYRPDPNESVLSGDTNSLGAILPTGADLPCSLPVCIAYYPLAPRRRPANARPRLRTSLVGNTLREAFAWMD